MKHNQPIWHDRDLLKVAALCIVLGIGIGFIWGYDLASPDLSKQPITYVKG
jgi:hypothetical protein